MKEIDELHGVLYWLIELVQEINAVEFEMSVQDVTRKGKKLGSWRLTLEKIKEDV